MSATVDHERSGTPATPNGGTVSETTTTAAPRRKPRMSPKSIKANGARGVIPKSSRTWFGRHRKSMLLMLPLLVIAALMNFINMAGNPQRIDDEGTYTAQAWAVSHLGELAHYTYWYDHPPMGWIQMSLYMQLTGAFERYDIAVIAARESVVVAALISTVLVFWLCRRLHFGRPAAIFAAAIFALSPLAIQYHRTVYLDNIATVWLLLALILATARRYQLAGFAASAACFGIAVLSKETYLLAIVLVAWVMIRRAHHTTRRYTLAVAGSVLVLIGVSYLLLAAVKGELFPGPDRVSLWDGVAFQLAGRDSSGSLTDGTSQTAQVLGQWFMLDPILCVLGIVAGVVGLFHPRVRPFAVTLLALVAFIFRPGGYLPVPYVIMLIPIAAIVIAGVTQTALRSLRSRRTVRKVQGAAAIGVLLAAAAFAVPHYYELWKGQLQADLDRPSVEAQQWVEQNVPKDSRLLVDDAMWVDLVNAGFARENVIWYYKIDTDSQVIAQSPNGWQDSDYIITTDSMRTFVGQTPQVAGAMNNSTIVASFGTGAQQVDVRQIHPEGMAESEQKTAALLEKRGAVGAELASNPRISFLQDTQSQLRAGQVDSRIMLGLAQLSAGHEFTVSSFPAEDGTNGQDRRQVVISALDGAETTPGSPAAAQVSESYSSLAGVQTGPTLTQTDQGVLISYPLGEPANLLDPA